MEVEFRTRNERQGDAYELWLNDTVEEILYGGAKGGGKSFLGAALIFGDALVYDETHYFIARRRLIDLRNHTIPTIHEVFKVGFQIPFDKYCTYNGQDHVFLLKNKSKVHLIPCDDLPSDPLFERFGSMQMTRGWGEEAGEIPEAAKANLALSIGRWKNDYYKLKRKFLLTANPKKGYLKRDFVDPWKQGLLAPKRAFIPALATDNPYLPADYVEALKNEKDKVRRQRLYEGNWDYDDDLDSLITYDSLTDAFSNHLVKSGEKYLIVDIARLGKDSTVFSFWDGLELYRIEQYRKQATSETIQKIKDFAAGERIQYSNILVDEDGVGGGVVDQLFGVKGFTANSTPMPTATQIRERQVRVKHDFIPKTTFSNLKAQCGWKIAELINERKIAFKIEKQRDEIIEDLTSQLRDHDPASEGRKRLRAKDDVKVELGRSPDIGDTIIMRAYFELAEIARDVPTGVAKQVAEEQVMRFTRNRKNREGRSSE